MESIFARRWMTLLADGTLTKVPEKRPGIQLVIGGGYSVGDFANSIANRTIDIKSDCVALMVGGEEMPVGQNINVGKQIERLIQQIWIVKPKAQLYVSSVIPKPTQETVTQAQVMKINGGIANMCRRLTKYSFNTVKYMPLHQEFLEKWKHTDKSGKMRISTRVVQPHGRYFQLGTDMLNEAGVVHLLDNLEKFVKNDLREKWPLMERPGLKVQVQNKKGTSERTTGSKKRSEEAESVGKKSVASGQGGEPKKPKPGQNMTTELPSDSGPLRKRMKKGGELKQPTEATSVARMVDKWEKLSQSQSGVDELDVELGEESIVPVDLGDQMGAVEEGEVLKLVMDM